MAKLLPYFKFFSSEWNDGDITLEDYKTQGVFINICSYYWSKGCNVPFNHVFKRFKDVKKEIDILVSNEIIYDCNGQLCIKFLDEQLEERKAKSLQNSKNAKLRWEKNANASKSQSESDTIKIIEVDNSVYFKNCLNDYLWLESVAMRNKLSIDNVKKGLGEFETHLITQKKQHINQKEFCSHFSNWVNQQKMLKQKPKKQQNRL